MTNPTKPRKIDLTTDHIYVPALDRDEIAMIIHTTEPVHSMIGHVDAILRGELRHTFELTLELEVLSIGDRTEEEDEADWLKLREYTVHDTIKAFDEYERLAIARLTVLEFPGTHRFRVGYNWSLFLSEMDGEGSEIGPMIDEMYETNRSFRDLDGTLFFLTRLDVHPAFRGQQIGAKLIGSALWQLHRSLGDAAAMLVKPVTCSFGGDQTPDVSPDAIRRLVQYYNRMGFRQWRSRRRIKHDGFALMYSFFGEQRLKFTGGGWSSK